MLIDTHDAKEGYVKAETHNYIHTIEFFHPQGNSLPSKILAQLSHENKLCRA